MVKSNDNGGPNGPGTPDQTALYIASMVDELAKMARGQGFDVLSYLLEMAKLEANQLAKD